MAMSTKQSSALSLVNFLKEGLLLPSRNRSLFAAVFMVMVISTSLVVLTNRLTFVPITEEIIHLDVGALNGTGPSSPDHTKLHKEIQDVSRELMITGMANLLFATVVGSAVKIVVVFATVATYSGNLYTFGTILGKAKARLKGPLLAQALVFVMEVPVMVLMSAMAAVVGFIFGTHNYVFMLLVWLIALSTSIFTIFFSFLGSLSVIVAVAERGCQCAGAVRRAWRLLKGKRWQAVLFVCVTNTLPFAALPVHKLAARLVPESLAAGLPSDVVRSILTEAINLFAICAMTAFYYECKESEQVMATDDEYVRLFMEEANA